MGLGLAACRTSSPERPQVVISTSEGDITVSLFDDTPLHSNNFIALADSGFYDGTLFHRVMRDFMIQGGDPDSRDAGRDVVLGSGDAGYNIDAEFRFPTHYHRRGALAAARESDEGNPLRQSSGSLFYIVWGRTFTDAELDNMELSRNERILQTEVNRLYQADSARYAALENKGDMAALQQVMDSLRTLAKADIEARGLRFSFPDSIREVYKTVGGTPWLDGEYTVFGEVVEGLDVVDRLQRAPTDAQDRPVRDQKMKMKVIR